MHAKNNCESESEKSVMHNLNRVPWYLPSLYGDIRLTAQGPQTQIEYENLTPTERDALLAVGKKFDFSLPTELTSGSVLVMKPIVKVESAISKAMKRDRKLLSAVTFKGGRIEELHRTGGPEELATTAVVPATAALPPVAAVTVAQPTIGCPLPEFERADVLATRVLKTFLTPEQLADFERTQSFLVTGGDTGRLYILTSRQASPERLARVGGRSVFDVEEGRPICVHDWVVPAAEELLELKLFLELPGHESYVRTLPEA